MKKNKKTAISVKSIVGIICSVVLLTGSGWLFTFVLEWFGVKLKLLSVVNGERQLTTLGFVMGLLIMGGAAVFTLFRELYEYVFASRQKSRILQLNQELSDERNFDEYINAQMSIINDRRIDGILTNTPKSSYDMLLSIQEALNNCVREFLTLYVKNQKWDSYASILFRFPNSEESDWVFAPNSRQQGLERMKVLSEQSTFSRLVSNDDPYLFYNSKAKAIEEDSYITDALDPPDLPGSIICFRRDYMNNGKVLINMVIGVSTYRKPILEHDRDFSESEKRQEEKKLAELMQDRIVKVIDQQIFLELIRIKKK